MNGSACPSPPVSAGLGLTHTLSPTLLLSISSSLSLFATHVGDPLHHCATGAVLAVGLSFVIALTSLLVSMILLSCREEWPGSLSATAVAMPLVVGALLIFLLTIVVCVQSCEAWMNVSYVMLVNDELD